MKIREESEKDSSPINSRQLSQIGVSNCELFISFVDSTKKIYKIFKIVYDFSKKIHF